MKPNGQEVMHEPAVLQQDEGSGNVAIAENVPQLADDEVLLTDGRIVKMKETNGADEAAVAQILGDKISLQGAGPQTLVQANALKAIVSIDGTPAPVINSYANYLAFARQFSTRNLMRITKKYAEMNLEASADNPLA